MKKWIVRLVGGSVALLSLLVGAGAVYQAIAEARDRERLPPPGRLVEVDGRAMHLDCRGEGSPTVIVEPGLSSAGLLWDAIHGRMARITRVCMYDRAGLGYSEFVRGAARAARVAERLDDLLEAGGIDDDLVLVGWSAGGLYVRAFERRYPERVRGMLLLDSSHEQQGTRQPEPLSPSSDTAVRLAKYLGPFGVVRLSGMVERRFESFEGSAELRDRLVALYQQSHIGATMVEEWEAFALDSRSDAPTSLGDLPLIVLIEGREEPLSDTASPEERAYRQRKSVVDRELHEELASLSSRGRLVVAADSGHAIHVDQPELVLESLRELVEVVRAESGAQS